MLTKFDTDEETWYDWEETEESDTINYGLYPTDYEEITAQERGRIIK